MELYKNYEFMKNNMNKTNRELAKELNCAHSTIKYWREKFNLANPRTIKNMGTDTYKNEELFRQVYNEIGNNSIIAKIFNVSDDTIEYWRIKYNIEKSDKWRNANRKYKLNHHFFKEIDNEEKAYWLGFLMADGCVVRTDSHKTYNRLEVHLKSSDYMHLKKLNNSLNANYPIKIFNKTNKTLDFDYSIARLRITSSILVSDLIKNNITPNKTGKEIIPNTVPKKLIKHFIRGFLDGDGTITVNKTSGFCSSSITIIEEINNFIYKELNMKCNILKSNDNVPIYTISYSSKKSKILLDYLYKDSKIYLDRKYKRYIDLFSSPIQ